jgi:hypothetical protein
MGFVLMNANISKPECYAQKLNRLFWYGVLFALPMEFAGIALLNVFDGNMLGKFLFAILLATAYVVVPLLGVAGIVLAGWARFTTGSQVKLLRHLLAGIVLLVFAMLAYRAVQVYQQMQHRMPVQAEWAAQAKLTG